MVVYLAREIRMYGEPSLIGIYSTRDKAISACLQPDRVTEVDTDKWLSVDAYRLDQGGYITLWRGETTSSWSPLTYGLVNAAGDFFPDKVATMIIPGRCREGICICGTNCCDDD